MDQLRRGEYFKVHGWKNSNGSTITNIGLIQRTYFLLLHSFPGQIAFEHVDAHMVDPGFGAPSYDDWYGNDVADKPAVEGRLLVAATKIHCAEPFNPLHHNLPRNPYTNNNNNNKILILDSNPRKTVDMIPYAEPSRVTLTVNGGYTTDLSH